MEGSHVFENGCCWIFGLQLKLHKYMLYGNWLWVCFFLFLVHVHKEFFERSRKLSGRPCGLMVSALDSGSSGPGSSPGGGHLQFVLGQDT